MELIASLPLSLDNLTSVTPFPNLTLQVNQHNHTPFNISFDETGFPHKSDDQLLEIFRPKIVLIHKIIVPIWWLVGFPGNALAFSVWIQPRMRSSSGTYLAALAFTDLTFLFLHVLFEIQNTWRINLLELPVLCQTFPILFLTAQYLSLLLVFAFTVERYISVCFPFFLNEVMSTRRAVRVIVCLILATLSVNAMQAYFWEYSTSTGSCGLRESVLVHTESGLSLWVVWSWVTELLVFGAFLAGILVFNILVIIEMRRMSKRNKLLLGVPLRTALTVKRSHSVISGKHKAPSATTIMLLVVSFYLIVVTLPVTLCYILSPSFPVGDANFTEAQIWNDTAWQTHFNFQTVRIAIQDCGMSHFALNFYIYLVTGAVFRKELRRLLRRCRRKSQSIRSYNFSESFDQKSYASDGPCLSRKQNMATGESNGLLSNNCTTTTSFLKIPEKN